jgi:hypothetical protein
LMAKDKDGSADVGMMREIDDRMRAKMTSLERQVSGLRTRSLFLTLILIAFVAAGVVVVLNPALLASALMSGGAGELSVTRLVLVDEAGIPRGEWSVDGEGNARLSLLDQQSRQRLNLTVLANGFPGLSLSNAQEQRRAVLGLLPDGTSTLVFADATGVARTVLGLDGDDVANLIFADGQGDTRFGVLLGGEGTSRVIGLGVDEGDSDESDDENQD